MPQFKVLGAFEVLDGDRNRTPTPPKLRSVLALLLLHANRVVSVDSLVEELWGTESAVKAVRTLQTYIYHLRRMFAAEGLDPLGKPLIETRPAGYLIRAEPDQVDAEVFQRRRRLGQQLLADDRPAEAAALARQALAMWTGPALVDVAQGALLSVHAADLEEQRTNAFKVRIQADVKLGRHDELIADLGSLVRVHPLNEWFHGQLIAALSRSGRRAEALQAYRNVRVALSDELGVYPSPELQRLQQRIFNIGAPCASGPGRRHSSATAVRA